MTWARFDDLGTGTAIRCPAPDLILVAEHPGEVVGVLAEVERPTDAGRWAFAPVGHSAAVGLDPHLAVHGSTPLGMPLAWSGICDEPIPVPPLDRQDTFQCDLTVRMAGRVAGTPPSCTATWRSVSAGRANPHLDLGRFVVASASPAPSSERRGAEVLLRP